MEENIMYSTELIRKFPDNPKKPILYVVYNEDHILEAELFIGMIHGKDYLKNVKIIPSDTDISTHSSLRDYDVYIDPVVHTYKNSWNN